MAVANVFTRSQPTEVGFVATAVAFSRGFSPTASHVERAVTFAITISHRPHPRISPDTRHISPREHRPPLVH